jgi:GntR family transcriptional regulator
VSLGTLRKALGVLEAEKLIVREPGRGTFARGRGAGVLSRFDAVRAADGSAVASEVIAGKAKVGAPKDEERKVLRLAPGEKVIRFHRTRLMEKRPFAYELISLPERRFPNLMLLPEIAKDLEGLAQASGLLVARAEAKIKAKPAPPAAAAALSLHRGAIALTMERVAFDTDDQPIELMIAYFDLRDEFCGFEMR